MKNHACYCFHKKSYLADKNQQISFELYFVRYVIFCGVTPILWVSNKIFAHEKHYSLQVILPPSFSFACLYPDVTSKNSPQLQFRILEMLHFTVHVIGKLQIRGRVCASQHTIQGHLKYIFPRFLTVTRQIENNSIIKV